MAKSTKSAPKAARAPKFLKPVEVRILTAAKDAGAKGITLEGIVAKSSASGKKGATITPFVYSHIGRVDSTARKAYDAKVGRKSLLGRGFLSTKEVDVDGTMERRFYITAAGTAGLKKAD